MLALACRTVMDEMDGYAHSRFALVKHLPLDGE